MTALTPLDKVTFDHRGISLWPILLDAEQAALKTSSNASPLVAIRVLGHLFEDVWNHRASYLGQAPYLTMIIEISSCGASITGKIDSEEDKNAIHDKLYALGRLYRNYMLHFDLMAGHGRHYLSEHPSRPSFEVVKQRMAIDMASAPTSKANVKSRALFRDGYRCTVTGLFDRPSCRNYPDIDAKQESTGVLRTNTEAAHIFSESAQDGDRTYGSTALALLKLFGLGEVVEKILGGNVNSLVNVMTMAADLHQDFDLMNLWFKPVPNERNTYKICGPVADEREKDATPTLDRVTFRLSPEFEASCGGNSSAYLPSPELLTLRAACSRVCHMSGAAQQVDDILRELELSTVMSYDGGSAELLAARLSMVSPTTLDVHG